MANAILTSKIAVPFLAEVESNLPILQNGTVQYNKTFAPGAGNTLDILVPTFGNSMGTGADVTSDLSDVQSGARTITLTQYHKAASLNQVEQAVQLSSFDKQVAAPFGRKMASDIQKLAFDELYNGAATVTAGTTLTYANLSSGITALESSYANGDFCGVMSPKLAEPVLASGVAYFQADLKEQFVSGKLGVYRGTRFFSTQDAARTLVIGAQTITTPTVTTTYVAGATSLVMGAVSLVGIYKAGQTINVVGVNSVDIYGNDTGIPYAITLQADVTAAANAATLTVQPMYASGPLKNVTALPTATNVWSSVHSASSKYQSAIVWDSQAFVTASAKLKPLGAGVESISVPGDIMGLMCQQGVDIRLGTNIIRWDTYLGFLLIYKNLVSRIDYKIG